MFHLTYTGHLGADPELRFTPDGRALCILRVAHTGRRKHPQTDQWEDTGTLWTSVALYGPPAEAAVEQLRKGTRVLVTGRATPRDYQHNGQQRQALDVTADTVAQVPTLTPTEPAAQRRHPGWDESPTGDGWTQAMRRAQAQAHTHAAALDQPPPF